jgi:hypothetical protein
MFSDVFLWGMAGGLVAALVALVRELAVNKEAIIESWRTYLPGWMCSLTCQMVIGGIASLAFDGRVSYFLTGVTSLGLIAYLISQSPTLNEWASES